MVFPHYPSVASELALVTFPPASMTTNENMAAGHRAAKVVAGVVSTTRYSELVATTRNRAGDRDFAWDFGRILSLVTLQFAAVSMPTWQKDAHTKQRHLAFPDTVVTASIGTWMTTAFQ